MIVKEKIDTGHWYKSDGTPAYTIIGKNGLERGTTLRDAKTEGLLPSVTTILNIAAKHGLQTWLQQQVLMAALTLPKNEGETEPDWMDRVMIDAKEQGKQAANRGTKIHAIMQAYYENVGSPEWPDYVHKVNALLNKTFGEKDWQTEQSFGCHLGFGGKLDLSCDGVIIDFKTKEVPLEFVIPYHDNIMQLAAYRIGIQQPNARCANLYINALTNEVKIVEHTQEQLNDAWECFQFLLSFYRKKNKL